MLATAILVISALVQAAAAFLSFRFIPQSRRVWGPVCVALGLMAVRRGVALWDALCSHGQPDPLGESIALAISALMVIGVLRGGAFLQALSRIGQTARESEANFRMFFETVDDIFVAASSDGQILFANQATRDKLGYSDEELAAMHLLDWHRPEDRPAAEATFAAMLQGEKEFCPLPLVTRDGSLLPVETRAWPSKWNGADCIFGICKDLSAQQEAQQRFESLFRHNPSPMAVSSIPDRIFFDVNEAFLAVTGYSREEIIGKTSRELGLVANPDEHNKVAERLRVDGRLLNFDLQLRRKNGELRSGLFSGEVISIQGREYFLTVMLDITEYLRVEEQTRFLSAITANMSDSVIATDEHFAITYLNRKAEELFGYTLEEVRGKTPGILNAEPLADDVQSELYRTVTAGGVFQTEALNRRKDGTTFYCDYKVFPLLRSDGKPYAYVGMQRDVTDRKQAETELLQSKEKLERTNHALQDSIERASRMAREAEAASTAKSRFLANMSHEIRTPMNGVIGMAGLLLDTQLNEAQRQYAEIIRSSGDALLQVINDILDFSKIEVDRLELEEIDFDLRTTMDNFAELMEVRTQEKGLQFSCGIGPDVPVLLRGDPGRLRQVLINLTGNAIKFTSEGEVVVRVALKSEEDDRVALRFSVRDTGIGIPANKVSLLFQAFQQLDASTTREYGGTGLGLAICKRLVEMMGGKIGVESREGEGATFWFTAFFNLQGEPAMREPPELASLEGRRMLIVDSHLANREVLGLMLDSWGVLHKDADCAEAAIQRIEEAAGAGAPFDVAILDMQMPDMTGEALGTRIRRDAGMKSLALVIMTSIGQRGDGVRFREAGFDAYLTKPVKQLELHSCLATVLGEATQSQKRKSDPPSLITRHSLREDQRARCRILLAEDNIVNQQVALRVLEKMGYNVEAVPNGEEAVKAVRTGRYDLVLMDVQMPIMDGFAATAAIRAEEAGAAAPRIPIIAMTAHAMKGDKDRCLENDMDDYIAKPIEPGVLVALLDRWLPTSPRLSVQGASRGPQDLLWDRELMLTRVLEDQALLAKVVGAALKDLPRQIAALRRSVEKGNAEASRIQAHCLKGAAANLAAESLRAAAENMEAAGAEGNLTALQAQLSELEAVWERVAAAMRGEDAGR